MLINSRINGEFDIIMRLFYDAKFNRENDVKQNESRINRDDDCVRTIVHYDRIRPLGDLIRGIRYLIVANVEITTIQRFQIGMLHRANEDENSIDRSNYIFAIIELETFGKMMFSTRSDLSKQ